MVIRIKLIKLNSLSELAKSKADLMPPHYYNEKKKEDRI